MIEYSTKIALFIIINKSLPGKDIVVASVAKPKATGRVERNPGIILLV